MIYSGTEMYDLSGNRIKIEKFKDSFIHAIVIKEVEIRRNDGRTIEKQITEKSEIFSFNDLGIRLFFNKGDSIKHKRLQIEDKRYFSNYDNIFAYFSPKFNSKADEIKEDKPIGTILTPDLKEQIIKGYYSYDENIKQEKEFHSKNRGCFGRIDLDTEFYRTNYERYHKEHYYDKVYISKELYESDGDIHIVNWRSPIASMFYDNENTKLTRKSYIDIVNESRPYIDYRGVTIGELELGNPLNVYNFELMLKRTYSFNPLKYINTYIAEDDFYLEGSTDSFLLEVLEENRSNHKITDIIKSIQSNQNKIMRHAVNKNMIIQGCAGSGKTMILLHRISYLLFNTLLPVPSEVKIITPNEYFSEFIKDLVNSLELGAIERTTMTNYYLSLIKRYQDNLSSYLTGEIINKREIAINREAYNYILDACKNFIENNNVTSETKIDFNEKLIESINVEYKDELNKFCENIDEQALFDISNRIGVEYDRTLIHGTKDYFDNLHNLCSKDVLTANEKIVNNIKILQDMNDKNIKKSNLLNNLLQDIEIIESYISIIKEIYTQSNSFKQSVSIYEMLKDLNKSFSEKNNYLETIEVEYQGKINDIKKEIKTLKSEEKSIPFNQIYHIKTINDKINLKTKEMNLIMDEYENDKKKIKLELQNINLEFNNLLAAEFTDIGGQLSQEEFLFQINEKLNSMEEKSNVTDGKTTEVKIQLTNKINMILTDLRTIKFDFNSYEKENYLNSFKYLTELKNTMNNFLYKLDDIESEDINRCTKLINLMNEIIISEKKKTTIKQDELSKLLLTNDEKIQLNMLRDRLQVRGKMVINIYESIRDDIRAKLNINTNKKIANKSEVLIILYLYYLYCGELSEKDSFLFIDEGQDYSIMEYKLLRLINGDKCLFNIFGDVKQLLNTDTGMEEWDLLKELINADYYELKENFRNTVEITSFVNKRFDYNLNPIGVHGPDVEYIQSSKILGKIKTEINYDAENRIAVIVKNKEKMKVNEKYKDQVFYYNVKEVKGLEFDIAFVITEGMNTNEQYISYTRALNKLYIIKEQNGYKGV